MILSFVKKKFLLPLFFCFLQDKYRFFLKKSLFYLKNTYKETILSL